MRHAGDAGAVVAASSGASLTRRTYFTLDGIRGAAALLVTTRHVPAFFGWIGPRETFLAVDLFYLISGFVIAHAYGESLRAGGFVIAFVKTRLIRLYPLYLLGMAIAVAATVISASLSPQSWWTGPRLAQAIGAGLFLVPLLPGVKANGASLNGPTWTLLPELLANILYALIIPFLRVRVLALIVFAGAAGLVYAEFDNGSLDVGYARDDIVAGLIRAGFSFFAGVLVFRLRRPERARVTAPAKAWALIAAATGVLIFCPPDGARAYYELAAVLIGFPVLLALAAHYEPGPMSARLFATLGAASYAIYVLHQPLGRLARMAVQAGPHPPLTKALVCGAAFLIGLLLLARWLVKHYDTPLRRALAQRL